MKYSFVIAALLASSSNAVRYSDIGTGNGLPISHKDPEGFKPPKNNENEKAMSTTTDPYNYKSGSGKSDEKWVKRELTEAEKNPPPLPGMTESTETAGTTKIFKNNANDSPPLPGKAWNTPIDYKKIADAGEDAEKE